MTNDIPVNLRVPAQFPLDAKTYKINEAALQDLGAGNNLAYTYHKGLEVTCIEERTKYEWKEIEVGEIGLLSSDFTYPPSLIVGGVDYSSKVYNFVKVELSPLVIRNDGIVIRSRNEANYGNPGYWSIDFSESLTASENYGAQGQWSSILGGRYNLTSGNAEDSVIGAGYTNKVYNRTSGIFAGSQNTINSGNGTAYFIGAGHGNLIQTTSSLNDSSIVSGNGNIINSGRGAIVNGTYNLLNNLGDYGFIGNGDTNSVLASKGFIGNGFTNKVSGQNASVINGSLGEAKGHFSVVLNGTFNIADSFGEVVGGVNGTTYVPISRTSFNIADRIFNIGIGASEVAPKDAISIFKNGLATLPTVTNALITAGSVKSIVTKEYVTSVLPAITPDATTTVKGILKLANDLGGTSDLPTTPTALHKTGNESFTGQKGFINTNGVPASIAGTQGATNGNLINLVTGSTSAGGELIKLSSTSSNAVTNITKLLVLDSGSLSIGMPFTIQNNSADTFTINKLGEATGTKFIKQGGTASQYLMADGSVSTASLIKAVVVNIPSWSLDTGAVVATGLGTGKTLISIVPTLQCTTANSGYVVGEIVSVGGTQTNDSGGLADSGLGIQFTAATSDRFSVITNNRVDISAPHSGAIGNTGPAGNPNIVVPAQWAIRVVITYVD